MTNPDLIYPNIALKSNLNSIFLKSLLLVILCAGTAAASPYFQFLGPQIHIVDSIAYPVVSGDGSVVASADTRPWKWTLSGGFSYLSSSFGIPRATSYDGSIIVGRTGVSNNAKATMWTNGQEQTINGFYDFVAVNSDGNYGVLLAGNPIFASTHRYRRGMPAQPIGHLSGSPQSTKGGNISGDGSIIIGSSNIDPGFTSRAFYWTEAAGIQTLPGLENEYETGAYAISSDGSLISAGGRIYHNLVPIPGFNYSVGEISGDGNTFATSNVLWRAEWGWRDASSVFADAGIPTPFSTGYQFAHIQSMSYDGNTFAGVYHNGAFERAFVAHIPEPATIALLFPLLLRYRRHA